MTSINFVKGEGGMAKDIPLINEDGSTFDTSGYTEGTLTFSTQDGGTVLKTITVTIPSNGTARWAMTTADTTIGTMTDATLMAGQLKLTGTGLVKKTFDFIVYAARSLA